MKAWQISHFNGKLECLERSVPILHSPNSFLVKIISSNGYGNKLLSQRRKIYSCLSGSSLKNLPLIFGRDFVGLTCNSGSNIWGTIDVYNPYGSQGQYSVVPYNNISQIPDNFDEKLLSSLPYTAMTVMSSILTPYFIVYPKLMNYCLKFNNHLEDNSKDFKSDPIDNLINDIFYKNFENKNILIRAGSGGIATFAIQLFQAYGSKNIVAICNHSNFDLLSSLGVDHTLDYEDGTLFEHLKSFEQFDLIYDAIGDSSQIERQRGIESFIKFLKPYNGSKYVCIASPLLRLTDRYGVFPLGLAASAIDFNRYAIKALSKKSFFTYGFYSPNQNYMRKLTRLVEEGKIKPIVDKEFDFEDLPAAYDYFSDPNRCKKGKIVIANYGD